MEFICEQIRDDLGLGDEIQKMYLLHYVFRHICWELMWNLDKDLQLSLDKKEATGKWKSGHSAFIDTNFPAKTLTVFLERKRGKHKTEN